MIPASKLRIGEKHEMKRMMRVMLVSGLLLLVACTPQQASKSGQSRINLVVPAAGSATRIDPDLEEVFGGAKMVEAGHVQAAIDGPFDDVVRRYEKQYGASKDRIYSARGLSDALLYSGIGGTAKLSGNTIVLGPAWAMAYWGRGYAYNEMARYDDAIVELNKALALAPDDIQYLDELAYSYQQKHDFKRSLELYRSALAFADLTTSFVPKMKCKSLRGQGYDLVELHRLSEAEAAYHACLKIIPNEPISLGELEYIRDLRAKSG
jgi:tetratricopeptide (TPR) repeat protein